MKQYDAVVIGGGILGCMTARALRRWNISVLLLEQEEDVCRGITRANSAIVYPGYDNKPGTKKAELTVRGNANMAAVCEELDVPFSRCGSLLVTYDTESVPKMEHKFRNGQKNGVSGLRFLSGEEAQSMEPMLKPGVVAALYAPSTGTVNPWQLGIAAYENALQNGVHARMNSRVIGIRGSKSGYAVETAENIYLCKMVFNCCGASADKVQELIFTSAVHLQLDGAEYLVLDKLVTKPGRVIFHQARSCGKGITAIPCTEGNLLLSGVRKDLGTAYATTTDGLEELRAAAKELLPELDTERAIRSFGAVRPNPQRDNGESIHDYCIENPAPGFYSLIGIKTPGLTCSNELGMLLAEKAAEYLGAENNPDFDPKRKSISEKDNDIICQCEQISRAEIVEAVRRGASSVEGVKRRVGTGMGRCQGSRCSYAIEKLLEEYGHGTF